MKFLLAGLSTIFLILIYSGCKDTISGEELDKRIIPDKNVSFTQHIQPVFEVKCATSGCHEDATRAGGLSLTSYINTTADPSIVFPFEPNSSRLVWAIDPQFASPTPMPPIPYPPLTEN